ncbi:MAG: hypothetical protein Greene041662_162 [Candidatus Peregrinibacteria bacterium Greene0416_62]|nr:MAG: hypothetical protein Greene041662_162 [Candidatus Peregrinibacteria bacterium Greene0416_62]TSD00757.1 MAG: hypothetical protein Greene101449_20 [Candidatus Peregrinibacteria bacterium Greene1014_49]
MADGDNYNRRRLILQFHNHSIIPNTETMRTDARIGERLREMQRVSLGCEPMHFVPDAVSGNGGQLLEFFFRV